MEGNLVVTKPTWVSIINVALILGTIIGILQPACSTNIGLTQIILSLFHPEWTQEFLMRWGLVIVLVASCYMFVIRMMFRNTPLSVIWTEAEVNFLKQDGSEVKSHRKQLLRANQPNVTACFNRHTVSSANGKTPHNRIELAAYCVNTKLNDYSDISGNETGATDIIHIFRTPLPYKWYMPLIPKFVINRHYDRIPMFIRKYLVLRYLFVVYENEYNVRKPVIDLKSDSVAYQHFNLRVTIDFGEGTIPSDLTVRRLNNSGCGVIDVLFEKRPADHCVVIRLDKMTIETLRITWTQNIA